MSFNLVDLIKDQVNGQVLGQISNVVGESSDKTKSVVEGAIPALLGGFMDKASSNEGAGALFDAVKKQDDSILDNLSGMIASNNKSSLIESGGNALGSIFGGSGASGLVNAVSGSSGMSSGSTSTVLSMLAPMVMSTIKRFMSGGGNNDASGLATMLASQKDNIASAMPSGLADQLGSSGFMSNVGNLFGSGAGVAGAAAAGVAGLAGSASGAISGAAGRAGDMAGSAVDGVSGAAGSAADGVGGMVDRVTGEVSGSAGDAITGTTGKVGGMVDRVTGEVSGSASDVASNARGQVGGMVDRVTGEVSGSAGDVVADTSARASGMVDRVTGEVSGTASDAVSGVSGAVSGAADKVGSMGSGAVDGVSGAVSGTAGKVGGMASGAVDGVSGTVSGAAGKVGDVSGSVASGASNIAGSTAGAVGGAAGSVGNAASDAASTGSSWIKKLIIPLILAVLAFFGWKHFGGSSAPDVSGAASSAADSVSSAASGAADSASSAVSGMASGMAGGDIAGNITSMFGSATESLEGITDVDSAKAALPELTDFSGKLDSVTSMAGNLPDAAKPVLNGALEKIMPMLDKVMEIPGVGAVLGGVIEPLKEKLSGLAG